MRAGGSVGLVFYRFAKSTFYQRLYPTSKHSTFPNVKNQFLAKHQIALKTLKKSDIIYLVRIFVLPDDSCHILSAVQEVLDSFTDNHFSFIVFCFRFGEKMSGGLDLRCFKSEHVKKLQFIQRLILRQMLMISI